MLTQERLEEIRGRLEALPPLWATLGWEAGALDPILADVRPLLEEVERLAEQVSDCWLVLDALAREPHRGQAAEAAKRLLRKQRAPGWK